MLSSRVLVMFCIFVFSGAFFALSKPLLVLSDHQAFASTYIGSSIHNIKPTNTRAINTIVDPNNNIIQHIEGRAVSIKVDGIHQSTISLAKTVSDLLKEFNIELQALDEVSLPLDYELKQHDLVSVKRIKYRDYSEIIAIPYDTSHQNNPHIYHGLKVVYQLGENGKVRKHYRERIEDGKVVSRDLLKEELISKPIQQIIAHGTLVFTGPYKKKLRMLASSYNPTVEQCGPWGFTTFTGVKVRYGIVAVDPKVIPLGTWLYVSGYGYALAADIGGAVKGNKIDCFFFTSHKGSGWRGGYIDVYILENEP